MLAVFAALAAEGRCLERYLSGRQRAHLDGFPIVIGEYAGRPVLLCQTGLSQRALAGARAVFAGHPPQAVLSIGFAGGVVESINAGDILLCERVYLYRDGKDVEAVEESDQRLLALAEEAAQNAGLTYYKGSSATVDRMLGQPAEKAEIAAKLPVQAVEMESYWLGQAARQQGVPFLAVRAVIDGPHDLVPEALAPVSESGAIPWRPLLLSLGAHPGDVLPLVKLIPNLFRASRRLSAFAGEFLTLWRREAIEVT